MLQQFATHHPGSVNTASSSQMNNLSRAPCRPTRHFSWAYPSTERDSMPSSFFFLSILSPSSVSVRSFFLTFNCPEEGSCWTCITHSSLALLHFSFCASIFAVPENGSSSAQHLVQRYVCSCWRIASYSLSASCQLGTSHLRNLRFVSLVRSISIYSSYLFYTLTKLPRKITNT